MKPCEVIEAMDKLDPDTELAINWYTASDITEMFGISVSNEEMASKTVQEYVPWSDIADHIRIGIESDRSAEKFPHNQN